MSLNRLIPVARRGPFSIPYAIFSFLFFGDHFKKGGVVSMSDQSADVSHTSPFFTCHSFSALV